MLLTWQTDELTEDVTLAGQVTAKLFASTTGSDSDWIVKLIDVYPQKYPDDWKLSGYELMISDEIFRGRYRNSFEKPEPLKPGEVTPFTIDLHTADHVFKKGHRIMVQVQSTWFPLYDRNPQKVRAQHIRGERIRLSESHSADISFETLSLECRNHGLASERGERTELENSGVAKRGQLSADAL